MAEDSLVKATDRHQVRNAGVDRFQGRPNRVVAANKVASRDKESHPTLLLPSCCFHGETSAPVLRRESRTRRSGNPGSLLHPQVTALA